MQPLSFEEKEKKLQFRVLLNNFTDSSIAKDVVPKVDRVH